MDNEILQKLKEKYGLNKLRMVAGLYSIGLPEKYWFEIPNNKEKSVVDEVLHMLELDNSIVIVTNNIVEANKLVAIMIRDLHKKRKSVKYVDFVYVVNTMMDKFGQMNMDLIKELNNNEVIAITNIRSYGKMYDRMMGTFSSFVDSLFNGVLSKQVIMCLEVDSNELTDIGKIYGDELHRTIDSSFEIYQYIVGEVNEAE